MDLYLTRLKEMHPLLKSSTADEYAFRAAIGLDRHGHVTGASCSLSLNDVRGQGQLHWSRSTPGDEAQLDYIRVTEDAAEAVTLALVSVAKGWTVRRRLQRGEFADWLLVDQNNNSIALEVSGIDTVDVAQRRLRQKVDQVRQSKNVQVRAASVVELRPPRSRLATI